MPNYEVLDEQGAVVTVIESDTPPSPEDMAYIVAQKRRKDSRPVATPTPVDKLQSTGIQRAVDVGMEYVAGVDRPFASLVDFITTPIRAVEQQVRPYAQAMLGIRDVPDSPQAAFRETEPFSLRGMVAEKGEFAGEGVATDIAAGAGEFTGLVMSMNPAQRLTTQAIAKGLETGTAKNVFELLGSGKPIDDIVFGVTGGFGGEIAAAQADDPNAKEAARIAGQMITPSAAKVVFDGVIDYAANKLLTESLPNKEALKGASNYIYEQLKDVQLKPNEAARLSNNINQFFKEEITVDPSYGTIRNRLGSVLKSIEDGTVDFQTLDKAHSRLAKQAAEGSDDVARAAGDAARVLDDAILSLQSTDPAIITARELWRRQSTVGLLDDMFTNLTRTAQAQKMEGGKTFEQRLRPAMAQLLNNNKKSMYFTKAEKKLIDDFIAGKNTSEFLETIGSLSGGAKNIAYGTLSTLLGTAVYATANPSIAVPVAAAAGAATFGLSIAETARRVSLNALKRSGTLMKTSIKLQGSDGLALTKSYMANTPKDMRKPSELAALLINNNMDMTAFRASEFAKSSTGRLTSTYYDIYRRAINEEQAEKEDAFRANLPQQGLHRRRRHQKNNMDLLTCKHKRGCYELFLLK